jgi:hypothetical protein
VPRSVASAAAVPGTVRVAGATQIADTAHDAPGTRATFAGESRSTGATDDEERGCGDPGDQAPAATASGAAGGLAAPPARRALSGCSSRDRT